MINLALIGLGNISLHYIKALNALEKYNVIGVCDLDENAPSRKHFSCPFFQDFHQLATLDNLDMVLVATPPKTHYEICKFFLENHIQVLMEKPGTLSLDDLKDLINVSYKENTPFKVMYHWQTGSEIIKFNELYDINKIQEINVCINDDYCNEDGSIKEDKINLQGAWLDSGVNALSLIKVWLPFDKYQIKEIITQKCPNTNLIKFINVSLIIDEIIVRICVDWTQKRNYKTTYLKYDERMIQIDNSMQTIIDGDKKIAVDGMERLDAHYFNYLSKYSLGDNDEDEEISIHRILFDISERL